MKVGYARVSTHDQDLQLQMDALKAAGCEQIFKDTISGTKDRRPGLDKALAHLRADDVLVVWRLDRLGRNLRHLIHLTTELAERGVGFQSLTEGFDTTTNGGRLLFHIMGSLAEFERELIRERTMAGLKAARARGRRGGRPPSLDPAKVAAAKALHDDKSRSIADICSALGVSRSSLYRYLAR